MSLQLIMKLFPMLVILMPIKAFSQDTLFLRNGGQQIGKVLEISLKEVKYKKTGNADGPTYIELKTNISKINYKNGVIEEFEYIKPWNRPEENKEFKPVALKKHTEMKQVGSRFWYGDKVLNESEMQDILLETNYPQITNHIQTSKRQRGWQHIGFAAVPCGLASVYFLSESAGGLFSNQNATKDQQYEDNAKIFALLGIASITTSITLKIKRHKNNAAAIKLYQQKF